MPPWRHRCCTGAGIRGRFATLCLQTLCLFAFGPPEISEVHDGGSHQVVLHRLRENRCQSWAVPRWPAARRWLVLTAVVADDTLCRREQEGYRFGRVLRYDGRSRLRLSVSLNSRWLTGLPPCTGRTDGACADFASVATRRRHYRLLRLGRPELSGECNTRIGSLRRRARQLIAGAVRLAIFFLTRPSSVFPPGRNATPPPLGRHNSVFAPRAFR